MSTQHLSTIVLVAAVTFVILWYWLPAWFPYWRQRGRAWNGGPRVPADPAGPGEPLDGFEFAAIAELEGDLELGMNPREFGQWQKLNAALVLDEARRNPQASLDAAVARHPASQPLHAHEPAQRRPRAARSRWPSLVRRLPR